MNYRKLFFSNLDKERWFSADHASLIGLLDFVSQGSQSHLTEAEELYNEIFADK